MKAQTFNLIVDAQEFDRSCISNEAHIPKGDVCRTLCTVRSHIVETEGRAALTTGNDFYIFELNGCILGVGFKVDRFFQLLEKRMLQRN
ncbi:MAG: Uncharacterised protein [Flavobacteriia bacterium]|nr:MAG: Uncharacterised protein [Flavobacteriia bacterium]